jgi:two-component system sensor histidine kinase BaeS
VRGFGCLFVFVVLLAVAVGATGVWAVGTAVGFIESTHVGRLVAIGAVVVGGLLVLGGAGMVRSFARPVDELVDAAGRVEDGDYSARVDVRGPRDLRSLARAFNAMSARLEETDRQRRAYLADVTHELRTPLTVIQGQLEGVIDGVYPPDALHLTPILDQIRTLDGLIDDLRTLTLVETGGLTLRREALDVAVLITDTLTALRPTATAGGVELVTDLAKDLPVVEADPIRIRSVLSNLVTNAIRLTPDGGSVTVAATADGSRLHVAVHDTGQGFAPDLLPRAFERFVKGADSTGSGLGLAIARDLVSAHGGTIEARNETGGAVVEFALPLAVPNRES